MGPLDLDVATPDDVPRVLRAAADRYYESYEELKTAWQDRTAGRVWREYARLLEQTAARAERILARAV